jgi:hypothetical protein
LASLVFSRVAILPSLEELQVLGVAAAALPAVLSLFSEETTGKTRHKVWIEARGEQHASQRKNEQNPYPKKEKPINKPGSMRGAGLENRFTRKGNGGSNPSPSAS